MPINRASLMWIGILLLLFMSGIAGGYLYFSGRQGNIIQFKTPKDAEDIRDRDLSLIKIYYPLKDRLIMEEKRVRRQDSVSAMAASIIEEFLRGPSIQGGSLIPDGTRLLNTYWGKDGFLYVDLSDEIRRNFQGDAIAEFLLLKGLYDSLISNLAGIEDIKVLVEGKEIESIGGHISILYPLKGQVTATLEQ